MGEAAVIWGRLTESFWLNCQLFGLTLLFAIPLGLVVAFGSMSRFAPLRGVVKTFVWAIRGTPLMLQLLFVYFALPLAGIKLPDTAAALLAFTLNYTAYFAEIFRAGIQSINKGQYEAAHMLGMTYPQTMWHIIIPQMVRRVLPPMSNETINLVKDTSLIYILAMNDLLRAARTIVQREFDMTPFVVAACFYLGMTFVLTWVFKRLEDHFGRYEL